MVPSQLNSLGPRRLLIQGLHYSVIKVRYSLEDCKCGEMCDDYVIIYPAIRWKLRS